MIKIPDKSKRYSVTNESDVSGNIWYTKNIDFDESGYIKLSPRTVQVISDDSNNESYDEDFNIPRAIGTNGGTAYIVNSENPFISTLTTSTYSTTQDGGASVPTLSTSSRGTFWQGHWYVTDSTKLYYKTLSSGAWTDTGASLTTGVAHPVEVFRNRQSLCVGNSNTVKLLNTSHSTTVTLTIPSDFVVTHLAYSNHRMGVVANLSATASGQSQDAYFFVWDGASTEASSGYSVGTNEIVSMISYKGSWLLLSKTGELLYFNGGGFQTLAKFPFKVQDKIWSPTNYGINMVVEGELVYILIEGQTSTDNPRQDYVVQNNPGGIWCYDPQIGLYHKFSPSISQSYRIGVASGGINTTTDTLTAQSSETIPITGSPVKYVYNTGVPITGLKGGFIYFIIKVSPTEFRLATTKENAIAGTSIDLTGTGDSVNYFQVIDLKDYGQSYMAATGALSANRIKNIILDRLIFGFTGYNSTGVSTHYLGVKVPGFKNIGYYVTPQIESDNLEDVITKINLKYKLLDTNDTITVKYKDKFVINIPTVTPQRGTGCTWTSNKILTTTTDFSEVEDYINNQSGECELEVISGAGAGQMSQIASISENSGTYTITLEDELEGITASDTCNVIVDNWKNLGTVTSVDTLGYKEFPVSSVSKSIKFKIILSGLNIKIEEHQIINKTHKPSS